MLQIILIHDVVFDIKLKYLATLFIASKIGNTIDLKIPLQ